MNYMFLPLQKYFEINGRSRRKEFWLFSLLSAIVAGVLGQIPLIGAIVSLAFIIPGWTVGIRRMHDVGKSGWFILIPFYNIYLCFIDSESGTNKYGENPKLQG
ncbi:MAG: DUF805 domain-containing protein [Fusobacteriaceae bacterium]|nr:DUF805 domain-containing protein [Fusobacteriaceae bacterium]